MLGRPFFQAAFGGDLVRLVAALWILLHAVSWSISHEAFSGLSTSRSFCGLRKTEVVCGAYAGYSTDRRLVG